MGEEEKNSKMTVIVCVAIIIVVIIATVLGVVFSKKNKTKKDINALNEVLQENLTNENIINEIEENTTENETEELVAKIDETLGLVYSKSTKTGQDSLNNDYSYEIPVVNIDSDYAKKINSEVDEKYGQLIDDELNNIEAGLTLVVTNVRYDYYIKDNVLSLVISATYPGQSTVFSVYNIDQYTGKEITSKDLMNIKLVEEATLAERKKAAFKVKFEESYGDRTTFSNNIKNSNKDLTPAAIEAQVKMYDDQLAKTIADENTKADTSLFLNTNGNLCTIGRIYSLVGPEYFDYVVPLEQ